MEYANEAGSGAASGSQIRVARANDARGITYLLRNAPYMHLHVDWRLPVDWIGEPVFLVQPNKRPSAQMATASKLMGYQVELEGCLAITADPLPAAWVRVVALGKVTKADSILNGLFDEALRLLKEQGVRQVGWLTAEKWPNAYLDALGFEQISEIESFFKPDVGVPVTVTSLPDVEIRPVETADFGTLADLEVATFGSLWRQSEATLRLAWKESVSFDVMLENGRIIGFQFSTSSRETAHLVRMTMAPNKQGQGYGSFFLQSTLAGYKKNHLKNASLNTQVENIAARRLYQKFGFSGTGQRLPIWAISL